MTTRLEIITELRELLVDEDEMRWSTDDPLLRALKRAQVSVWQDVARECPRYQAILSTSPTAGVISLASQAPLEVVRVMSVVGTYRTPVFRADPGSERSLYQSGGVHEITYVPSITFPSSDGASFSWGGLTDEYLIERAMVLHAARQLEVVDDGKRALDTAFAEALQEAKGQPTQGGGGSSPLMSPRAPRTLYRWVLHSKDVLHLVFS